MIISIIGLGETGTAVSQLLLNDYRNIQLNISDPSEHISGRILDLAHAGIRNENVIFVNNIELLEKSDFVFFCAGTRNIQGASRESMANVNRALIQAVFDSVHVKESCKIIVISNPLDAMVTWISTYFENRLCVIGTGTLLDSWRLKYIIAQQFQLEPERIEAVVLGEHGDSMVPIWSMTKVDGIPIEELYGRPQLVELNIKLLSVAKEIRETENATKYGVAAAAIHLMVALLSKEEVITIASYPSQSSLSDKSGISFGQFVVLKEGTCLRFNNDYLNEEEKSALSLSVEKIRTVTYGEY
jgi:L-lactate dehydrogenase